MKILLDLFLTFARIGVCTFGGGYAIMPILQREIVEGKHWATESDIMDYYAIAQCTPGVIGVNTASFVGARMGGTAGAFVATFGFVLPSYIIIVFIAAFLTRFSEIEAVQNAFAGIQVVICALVVKAVLKMLRAGVIDILTALIFAGTFLGLAVFGLPSIALVIIAASLGILLGPHKEDKTP